MATSHAEVLVQIDSAAEPDFVAQLGTGKVHIPTLAKQLTAYIICSLYSLYSPYITLYYTPVVLYSTTPIYPFIIPL